MKPNKIISLLGPHDPLQCMTQLIVVLAILENSRGRGGGGGGSTTKPTINRQN